MAKAANFAANMHERSYRSWYEDKRVGSDSLINIDGRTTESLDGSWVFITDPYETSLRSKWHLEKRYDESGEELPVDYDFDRGERISVPSCWNMERPELFHFEGMGVYSRTFRYKPEREGERVFLEFEGASYRTYVFLNGVQVAMHDGASTPFSVEVTELLKLDNRLIVSVDASRSDSRVPMSNTDWFNYGGIYRSVNLVRLPKSFIKDHFIRLVPDGTFSKIQVSFEVDGVSKGEVAGVKRNMALKDRLRESRDYRYWESVLRNRFVNMKDFYTRRSAALDAVTADQVNDLLFTVLDEGSLSTLSVIPEE